VSVLDNREEVAAAEAQLAAASDERLAGDLLYWTVASLDHAEDYRAVNERLAEVRGLYTVAEQWIGMIAREIRRRRDAKRAEAGR
jgi:hypothetical protein